MKAIIYGIGSFAEYVSYVISNDSEYEVIGFCIDRELKKSINQFNGLPIVEFETVEKNYAPLEYEMFIAVGDNEIREQKFHQATEKGFNLLSYISSKATTWDNLKYGKNVFISENTGIQPFVTIGDNSILIGANVGHHSEIGNNNLLSCCYLAGNVRIANNCFIGLNAAIKQNISIGANNIIGMGCIITKNTFDNEIYSNSKTTKKSNVSSTRLQKKYLK